MIIFGQDGERLRAEWTQDRNVGHACTGCGDIVAQNERAIEPTVAHTGFILCTEDCLDEHNETAEAAYETKRARFSRVSRSPQTTAPAESHRPASGGAGHSVLLGARIRELRYERGWTQAELAVKLNTHRPLVARAERGTHYLTTPTLCRYAKAFEISLYEIIKVIDPLPGEECA